MPLTNSTSTLSEMWKIFKISQLTRNDVLSQKLCKSNAVIWIPSNENVASCSDNKTIRLYKNLPDKQINSQTIYLQIYNQLAEFDQPKRAEYIY